MKREGFVSLNEIIETPKKRVTGGRVEIIGDILDDKNAEESKCEIIGA